MSSVSIPFTNYEVHIPQPVLNLVQAYTSTYAEYNKINEKIHSKRESVKDIARNAKVVTVEYNEINFTASALLLGPIALESKKGWEDVAKLKEERSAIRLKSGFLIGGTLIGAYITFSALPAFLTSFAVFKLITSVTALVACHEGFRVAANIQLLPKIESDHAEANSGYMERFIFKLAGHVHQITISEKDVMETLFKGCLFMKVTFMRNVVERYVPGLRAQ